MCMSCICSGCAAMDCFVKSGVFGHVSEYDIGLHFGWINHEKHEAVPPEKFMFAMRTTCQGVEQ
jgi:hypothetical protein